MVKMSPPRNGGDGVSAASGAVTVERRGRHRLACSTEDHLALGLPVLFPELLAFQWTPNRGFPTLEGGFRAKFDRMQEVENLENDLRVFFGSFEGALEALTNLEVRQNIFRFLDQYGTIEDVLNNDVLRTPAVGRNLVPECLEEKIRNQQKWFKGDDEFSLEFAKDFLRRKFSSVRTSFRAPQPTSLLPPVPPPRRHRSGSAIISQHQHQPIASTSRGEHLHEPSTSQNVLTPYTASGRPRRNSAPIAPGPAGAAAAAATVLSPPKPRRTMIAAVEQLPSPPPTPPLLRTQRGNGNNGGDDDAGPSHRASGPVSVDDDGARQLQPQRLIDAGRAGRVVDDEHDQQDPGHAEVRASADDEAAAVGGGTRDGIVASNDPRRRLDLELEDGRLSEASVIDETAMASVRVHASASSNGGADADDNDNNNNNNDDDDDEDHVVPLSRVAGVTQQGQQQQQRHHQQQQQREQLQQQQQQQHQQQQQEQHQQQQQHQRHHQQQQQREQLQQQEQQREQVQQQEQQQQLQQQHQQEVEACTSIQSRSAIMGQDIKHVDTIQAEQVEEVSKADDVNDDDDDDDDDVARLQQDNALADIANNNNNTTTTTTTATTTDNSNIRNNNSNHHTSELISIENCNINDNRNNNSSDNNNTVDTHNNNNTNGTSNASDNKQACVTDELSESAKIKQQSVIEDSRAPQETAM